MLYVSTTLERKGSDRISSSLSHELIGTPRSQFTRDVLPRISSHGVTLYIQVPAEKAGFQGYY